MFRLASESTPNQTVVSRLHVSFQRHPWTSELQAERRQFVRERGKREHFQVSLPFKSPSLSSCHGHVVKFQQEALLELTNEDMQELGVVMGARKRIAQNLPNDSDLAVYGVSSPKPGCTLH